MLETLIRQLASAAIFTVLGLILFFACIWIIDKMIPYSLHKEIEEDHNVALGIVIGSMILGIAIILAACLHGDGGPTTVETIEPVPVVVE